MNVARACFYPDLLSCLFQPSNGQRSALPLPIPAAVQAEVLVPQVADVVLNPNDPGYVPEFAAWGPMYRITDPTGVVPPFTVSSLAADAQCIKEEQLDGMNADGLGHCIIQVFASRMAGMRRHKNSFKH